MLKSLEIKEFKFDDEEFILLLRHHFGSDQHYREHNQHFHRAPNKRFFVAFIQRELAGYCSLKGTMIGDISTIVAFRRKGVATAMLKHLQEVQTVLTIGTSNKIMKRMVERFGFAFTHYRGKYRYYKWSDQE